MFLPHQGEYDCDAIFAPKQIHEHLQEHKNRFLLFTFDL